MLDEIEILESKIQELQRDVQVLAYCLMLTNAKTDKNIKEIVEKYECSVKVFSEDDDTWKDNIDKVICRNIDNKFQNKKLMEKEEKENANASTEA